MFTKSKRTFTLVAITTAACLCCLTFALADHKGKPHGKPDGDGNNDPPPSGTVYFRSIGILYEMNADGSNKTALPPNVFGEPSRQLHGGSRWVVQLRTIDGEFYPNGDPREELFAVREDGDEGFTVQLTDDPALQKFVLSVSQTAARWGRDASVDPPADDGVVSFNALVWGESPSDPIGAGVYALPVSFDGNGNLDPVPIDSGLATPKLIVAGGINGQGGPDTFPTIGGHGWSPDGSMIVFNEWFESGPELRLADVETGNSVLLLAPRFLRDPNWSPDGTRIAFESGIAEKNGSVTSVIQTIRVDDVDGSTRTTLVKAKGGGSIRQVFAPRWSPDSNHVIYEYIELKNNGEIFFNVYRVSAGGGNSTNLTPNLQYARPIAWR